MKLIAEFLSFQSTYPRGIEAYFYTRAEYTTANSLRLNDIKGKFYPIYFANWVGRLVGEIV